MDLEVDLSSLDLNENKKKRNHSGVIKKPLLSLSNSSSNNDDNQDESPETQSASTTKHLRRSTRKKFRTGEREAEKRRVVLQPKKLTLNSSLKDIENYYMDKRIKRLPPSLETIYEEPQLQANKINFMSAKKFRRVINFEKNKKGDMKTKKRCMKAKSVSSIKKHNRKVTMELLLKKLKELDE